MSDPTVVFSDVIKPKMVDLNIISFNDKDALFHHMVGLLYRGGAIESESKFLEAIYERETLGPTYMGDFIAIPHGKSVTVKNTGIAFCRCNESFFYETQIGGGEVKLIFMLAIPDQMSGDDYIRILSRLARMLVYPEFIEELFHAASYQDVIEAIKHHEALLLDE